MVKQKKSKIINWEEIHNRLKTIQLSFEPEIKLTAEQKRKVLKQRAKILAREIDTQKQIAEYLEVVEFSLGYENYALETSYIREVYPLKEFTVIPCTPLFVLGVINFRGQLVSVINLKNFFELPEKGLSDLNKIIIINKNELELGILADVILSVKLIPLAEIQSTLATLSGIREEYLKGVTKERLIILDAEKILNDKKIILKEEVM